MYCAKRHEERGKCYFYTEEDFYGSKEPILDDRMVEWCASEGEDVTEFEDFPEGHMEICFARVLKFIRIKTNNTNRSFSS